MNKQEIIQKLINKFISPYSPDVSEGDHLYNQGKCEGIEIGFDACLTELAKQSGEFATATLESRDRFIEVTSRENFTSDSYRMIDIAALQSANAKIAQLEEDLRSRIEIKADASERIYNKLEKKYFNVVNENTELQQRVKELENFCEAQKVALSISMPKPLYEDMKNKLTTLEAKLQEAEKVISEYQTRCIDAAIKIGLGFNNGAIDQLQIAQDKAKTYLQNKGE